MSKDNQGSAAAALRDQILSDPSVVLEDLSVLKAILSAEDEARGSRVVDMRGVAMSRMESRIDHLEQTHQTVISAAYYNVSTTQQVHRAILTMIAPLDFNDFLVNLDNQVADCLRIRAARLVMESETEHPDSDLNTLTGTLSLFADRGQEVVDYVGTAFAVVATTGLVFMVSLLLRQSTARGRTES